MISFINRPNSLPVETLLHLRILKSSRHSLLEAAEVTNSMQHSAAV
jgi:hypothetical protein